MARKSHSPEATGEIPVPKKEEGEGKWEKAAKKIKKN